MSSFSNITAQAQSISTAAETKNKFFTKTSSTEASFKAQLSEVSAPKVPAQSLKIEEKKSHIKSEENIKPIKGEAVELESATLSEVKPLPPISKPRRTFEFNADLNGDRSVNNDDIVLMVQSFGTQNQKHDLNADNIVDKKDLDIMMHYYGRNDVVAANPDFNGDNKVDFDDLLMLARNYNTETKANDLTNDGKVGFDDLEIFAEFYGLSIDNETGKA